MAVILAVSPAAYAEVRAALEAIGGAPNRVRELANAEPVEVLDLHGSVLRADVEAPASNRIAEARRLIDAMKDFLEGVVAVDSADNLKIERLLERAQAWLRVADRS